MLDSVLYKVAYGLERVTLFLWEITGIGFVRRVSDALFRFSVEMLVKEV